MSVYQLPLPNIDPLRSLAEVERALMRVMPGSLPCRKTLIALCEDGTFHGWQNPRNRYWWVYQSSLDDYIRRMQGHSPYKMAA